MSNYLGDLSLAFNDEQSMLLDVARGFVRDKSPLEKVRAHLEDDLGFEPSVWQEMVSLGWSGIALPESAGGSGLGLGALVPVVESLGYGLLGTPLLSTVLAAELLRRCGGREAIPLLHRIAEGEAATFAFLDNADWGDRNTGVLLADDGQLYGAKRMVTDATVSSFIVVLCKRGGEPAIAVVERSALRQGAFSPNTLIDLTKRSANVDFTGVRPSWITSGNQVLSGLRDFRLIGALLTAAEATGSAARCLEVTVDYLKTRKQFGKLIGSYQALKHPTVDIYCGLENARSFVYHGATLLDEGALSPDAEIACRMAKAQASDLIGFAGDRCVQFHGGIGFTWDCDATLFIRRAQWSRQVFGDAIHHRKHLGNLLLNR